MQRRFTDIFIKRPVFATCISLVIILLGTVAFMKMDVRQYPKVDASVVQVTLTYPGANSEVMEGFIATPAEEAIAAVDGIDYMTSSSVQSSTTITVNLKLGYDINVAMTDITAAINSIRGNLPVDMLPPVIQKNDPSQEPILWYSADSTTMKPKQLTDFLIRVVQPQLQTVDGVSTVDVRGSAEYAMRIWLNPYLMAAAKITPSDIFSAIRSQNVIAPAGNLKSAYQQVTLYSSTDLQDEQQFNDLVLRNDNGHIVRIKDVGEAVLGAQNMDHTVYLNSVPSIMVSVSPKPNANVLDVVKDINKILPKVREALPVGTHLTLFYDRTQFIQKSIDEVGKTIIEASILVFFVIFLMLGSFRAVFVPMVTIPLSLAGACAIMMALGFTINTLTLLAFVLAIGLVVDDAIVVLENIHRHLEEGLTPMQAALTGAREISFAIVAMTLTLAAVYIPIGFMGGLVGQLFTEFAFTLAGAVLVSGFIALTLSPMMCSMLYKSGTNLTGGMAGIADKFFVKLRNGYKKLLRRCIKWRYVVLIGAIIIYALCYFLYATLQQELAPTEDQGVLYSIVMGPASANLDYIGKQTKQLEKVYEKFIPERQGLLTVNGYPLGMNSAFSIVLLRDWGQRERTSEQIRNTIFGPMWAIPGVEAFPSLPVSLPGAGGFTPIEFIISTTKTYDELNAVTQKFMAALTTWGGVVNVNTDLKIDQSQIDININRNRAADLGIDMAQVSTILNASLSAPQYNYFNISGRSYQVIPELYRKYRDIPSALNNLPVRTQTGDVVPLSTIVDLSKEVIPEQRNHFQELRAATVKANLAPGVSLGTALDHLNNLAKTTLPKGYTVDYGHQSRQFIQTQGTTGPLFAFALIFVFLILAAQFESFRDPLVVLLTVPLAFVGALLGLHLCGGTINIYTNIALITLIGLITKNGILIVEFANQQQERGLAFVDAILEGAAERLRPIIMTTCAMVLGSVPLAMATGAGAASRTQIGFVIVFGMGIGTIFTLLFLPTAYYFIASKKKLVIEEEEERAAE